MAFQSEINWIGKDCPQHPGTLLRTKVLQSRAGFFVGTQCPKCLEEDPSPHSRETHYYKSREDIEQAIDDGTLKWRDSDYHPSPFAIIE